MKDLDPKYTAKCTLQTVCDPEKGFFVHFLETVKEAVGSKWIENEFAKIASNEEKFKSVFDIGEVLGTLEHVSAVFKEKNQRVSVQRRLEGDVEAKAGNYPRSLLLYSQAVMRAPNDTDPSIDDGLTLAKALWSRSAVLVAMKKGELALNDLKYSQEKGMSVTNNPDFYWRMGQCYARKLWSIFIMHHLLTVPFECSDGGEETGRNRIHCHREVDPRTAISVGEIKS